MLGSSVVVQLNLSTLRIAQSYTPAELPREVSVMYLKHQAISRMFFILLLWFVKLAFMFLFRMLFWTSSIFRKLWWAVMGVLAATIWIPIIANFVSCGTASEMHDLRRLASQIKVSPRCFD